MKELLKKIRERYNAVDKNQDYHNEICNILQYEKEFLRDLEIYYKSLPINRYRITFNSSENSNKNEWFCFEVVANNQDEAIHTVFTMLEEDYNTKVIYRPENLTLIVGNRTFDCFVCGKIDF